VATALQVTFVALLVFVGIEAVCRALRFRLRQDLYRLRDRIYDRAAMGEIDLDTPGPRELVRFLHAFIRSMPFISTAGVIFIALTHRDEREDAVAWLEDPKVEKEAPDVMRLSLQAFIFASPLLTLACGVLYLLRNCGRPIRTTGQALRGIKRSLLGALAVQAGSTEDQVTKSSIAPRPLRAAH
jgi:hypothetical protein